MTTIQPGTGRVGLGSALIHWLRAPGVPTGGALTPWRGWGLAAYLVCLVFALLIGWTLFHVPFQVNDNVANMLTTRQVPLVDQLWANMTGGAYVRPLLWGLLKVLFEASDGDYFPVFRAFQALQVVVLVWLFVRVLGIRSAAMFSVAPLGTLVLLGFPTFRGLVVEAFPINTFLTVAVCGLAAVNLTMAKPSWRVDVTAVSLLMFATLTVENGLLLWPCYVAAFVVGLRGISWRGIAASTLCVVWYFVHRAVFLSASTPDLSERPSGFLFERLEPGQLVARFGDNPLPFYAYNVATSFFSVLFAEPRRGVFLLVRQGIAGEFRPGTVITVTLVTLTTIVMATGVAMRVRAWRRTGLTRADQMFAVLLSVLAGNAVIGFAYTKDEIMSLSGLFYAVAATVSFQAITTWFASRRRPLVLSLLAAVLMASLGAGWSYRYLDVLYHLNVTANRNQTDWVWVDDWKRRNHIDERMPDAAPLIDALKQQAISMPVPHPVAAHRTWDRYSDQE